MELLREKHANSDINSQINFYSYMQRDLGFICIFKPVFIDVRRDHIFTEPNRFISTKTISSKKYFYILQEKLGP